MIMERQMIKLASMLLMAFLMGNAQQLKAQDNADFGIWMDAGVEKKFNKQWSLEGEIGARTRNDSKEMDRYHLGIATDYKLIPEVISRLQPALRSSRKHADLS